MSKYIDEEQRLEELLAKAGISLHTANKWMGSYCIGGATALVA